MQIAIVGVTSAGRALGHHHREVCARKLTREKSKMAREETNSREAEGGNIQAAGEFGGTSEAKRAAQVRLPRVVFDGVDLTLPTDHKFPRECDLWWECACCGRS